MNSLYSFQPDQTKNKPKNFFFNNKIFNIILSKKSVHINYKKKEETLEEFCKMNERKNEIKYGNFQWWWYRYL